VSRCRQPVAGLIHRCECAGDFGPTFVQLARSVYRNNDYWAAIKRRINVLLGSALIEKKSYAACDAGLSDRTAQTGGPGDIPSR
jgi:hypothetical protein